MRDDNGVLEIDLSQTNNHTIWLDTDWATVLAVLNTNQEFQVGWFLTKKDQPSEIVSAKMESDDR